jgi:(p)ppGpp synthase/HD superfamily hydrolase
MNIAKVALETASNGHRGQTRWDRKTPYITHPIAVAEIARRIVNEIHNTFSLADIELILAASYLHDLAEDVERYKNKEALIAKEVFDLAAISIDDPYRKYEKSLADDLSRLNKHRHSNYLDFVISCKINPRTAVIKRADIEHNLSDLKNGSMKDKYILAKYILSL